jgi:N-carbamoylputrescine amidase
MYSFEMSNNLPNDDRGTYSYTPKGLVASYERLKTDEWFSRTTSNEEKDVEVLDEAAIVSDEIDDDDDAPMASLVSSTQQLAVDSSATASRNRHTLIVAATQITGSDLPNSDIAGFCFRAEQAIEIAAAQGAQLVLLPELWSGPYFCQTIHNDLFQLADPIDDNILVKRMQVLAKSYNVVLPISLFERHNNAFYNSVVVIESDGTIVGTYRKSHIPDAVGYQEKFYFTPGDTGFQVFQTTIGRIGVGIGWDQWFPECARSMVLQGADVLLYPTAIGHEPIDLTINTSDQWQRVMQGQSAANMIPIVASNRYGIEILYNDDDANHNSNDNNDNNSEVQRMFFYGRSFITNNNGKVIAECLDNTQQTPVVVITAEIDAQKNLYDRAASGLLRDRRPDLYGTLLTQDGTTRPSVK